MKLLILINLNNLVISIIMLKKMKILLMKNNIIKTSNLKKNIKGKIHPKKIKRRNGSIFNFFFKKILI